jgi:hypothetical protein
MQLLLLILLVSILAAVCLVSRTATERRTRTRTMRELRATNDGFKRLIFGASEFLGQITSNNNNDKNASGVAESQGDTVLQVESTAEMADLIRKEYENIFFLSGNMNVALYSPNCEFIDPFNSFNGTDRFKRNADNFAKFVVEPRIVINDVKVILANEDDVARGWNGAVDVDCVKVEWIFSSKLNLFNVLKPTLAASGYTYHFIDGNKKIFRYKEVWKTDPLVVIARLFGLVK